MISWEHLEIADCAYPLEGTEDDIIGVRRRPARDEILPLDRPAQRVEAGAEGRQARFAVAHNLFEGGAKALLT